MLKNFGKKFLKLEQTRELFPLHEINHTMQTRNKEKYKLVHANAERLKNSKVPCIQRMLNTLEEEKKLAITHCALLLVKFCYAQLITAGLHDF